MRIKESEIERFFNKNLIFFKCNVSVPEDLTLSLTKIINNEHIIEDFCCSFSEFFNKETPVKVFFSTDKYKIVIPSHSFSVKLKSYDDSIIYLTFDFPPLIHVGYINRVFLSQEYATRFIIEKLSNYICEEITKLFIKENFEISGYKRGDESTNEYAFFINEDICNLNIDFDYSFLSI